jgi:hypothetical protein
MSWTKPLRKIGWVGEVGVFGPAYYNDLSVEERVPVVDLFEEFFVVREDVGRSERANDVVYVSHLGRRQ